MVASLLFFQGPRQTQTTVVMSCFKVQDRDANDDCKVFLIMVMLKAFEEFRCWFEFTSFKGDLEDLHGQEISYRELKPTRKVKN